LFVVFFVRPPSVDRISPGAAFNYCGFCLSVGVCYICELM